MSATPVPCSPSSLEGLHSYDRRRTDQIASNAVHAQLALPISTSACKLRKYRTEENQFVARRRSEPTAEKPSSVFLHEGVISA
jgi:hypothetical protein